MSYVFFYRYFLFYLNANRSRLSFRLNKRYTCFAIVVLVDDLFLFYHSRIYDIGVKMARQGVVKVLERGLHRETGYSSSVVSKQKMKMRDMNNRISAVSAILARYKQILLALSLTNLVSIISSLLYHMYLRFD